MIIRGEETGTAGLVNQTDHSQFVGQLAAHWGNSNFEALNPYESVVRAAIYHDYGWLPYEIAPGIEPGVGEPYSFLNVGIHSSQLAAYQWVIDWMAEIDRYSALMMSIHRTGLFRQRYNTIEHPTIAIRKKPIAELDEFLALNEKWQEEQKKSFEAANLAVNYRLLQVWDLLGLYFCCKEVCEDFIEPVPTSYGSERGIRMTLTPLSPNKVAFDPYPFDQRPLKAQFRIKRLVPGPYASDAEFRKAYFKADNQLLEFELV